MQQNFKVVISNIKIMLIVTSYPHGSLDFLLLSKIDHWAWNVQCHFKDYYTFEAIFTKGSVYSLCHWKDKWVPQQNLELRGQIKMRIFKQLPLGLHKRMFVLQAMLTRFYGTYTYLGKKRIYHKIYLLSLKFFLKVNCMNC